MGSYTALERAIIDGPMESAIDQIWPLLEPECRRGAPRGREYLPGLLRSLRHERRTCEVIRELATDRVVTEAAVAQALRRIRRQLRPHLPNLLRQ
jgi:hypothetical protein